MSISGNSLTKTAPDDWFNAGASSTQTISSGNGYVEFTVNDTNTGCWLGLSSFHDHNYSNARFTFYAGDGMLYVLELGTLYDAGSYNSGDRLRVAIEGGVVNYYKNGVRVYTSSRSVIYPLAVDCGLYDTGATLANVVVGGNFSGGGSAQLRWRVPDQFGIPRMIFDGVTTLNDYLPFGEHRFAGMVGKTTTQVYSARLGLRQFLTDRQRDADTGLVRIGPESYHPSTQGQFTSIDSGGAGTNLSDPQSLNRYT